MSSEALKFRGLYADKLIENLALVVRHSVRRKDGVESMEGIQVTIQCDSGDKPSRGVAR